MNNQMAMMLALLDAMDDVDQREDLMVDMISTLLMQIHQLQDFMSEKGLTEDDFNEYLDEFENRTLH